MVETRRTVCQQLEKWDMRRTGLRYYWYMVQRMYYQTTFQNSYLTAFMNLISSFYSVMSMAVNPVLKFLFPNFLFKANFNFWCLTTS